MRVVGTAVALASVASAYTPALSYGAQNSTRNATASSQVYPVGSSSVAPLYPTGAAPDTCDAAAVTVYETVYATAGGPPPAKPTASGPKVGKPYGYKQENFYSKTEGDVKLEPCNHWTHNANNPQHLVPTAVGDKTQLYYAENGDAQPSKTFYFGVIDLDFKAPAVVLGKSAYVSQASYANNKLVVDFSSTVACDFAKTSWTKGMIIVSSTTGCKKSTDDDQCYFEVDDIVKSDDGKSVIIKGTPKSQDECTHGGEAQWGMYRPSVGNNGNVVTQPGKNTTTGSNGPSNGGSPVFSAIISDASAGPTASLSSGPFSSGIPTASGLPNATDNESNKFGDDLSTCKAPMDTKYNLPTACTGEYFDIDLDEALGYGELSADDLNFLKEATAGLDSDTLTKVTRRAILHRRYAKRGWFSSFTKFVAQKIVAPAVSVLKTAVNVTAAVVQGAVQLVTTGTISGSIKESFAFALPDGSTAAAKQVDSPWGPAILIAAYGTESKVKADAGVQREGYLNIFCVGCGAQGRVELAGRATWSVINGITQGELEAWADMKAALKIGVDAQIKLSKDWKNNLFQIGLPGLSFGVITIGPQVRVDSRVTLEAQAEGRILAGAELNWNRAYAKIDLVDPSKSTRQNFDPVPHPVFEAEGSIFVGAELGLPIGLHFGISITSWKKTVALINEPMIKGIAKAAARAELVDGKFTAGFTPTDGCVGINTNLSWRNRLYGNILDIKEFDIMDTGYKSIKSACIAIGKQPVPSPVSGSSAQPSPAAQSPTSGDAPAQSPTTDNTPAAQSPTSGDAPAQSPTTDDTPAAQSPTTDDTPAAQSPTTDDTPAAQSPTTDNTPAAQNPTGDDAATTQNTQTGDRAEESERRSIQARQEKVTVSTSAVTSDSNTTTTTAPASGLPDDVEEITDHVKAGTNAVNYQIADIPTTPYVREDGYEFTKLIAEGGSYNIMFCSNGNMYVKQTTQTAGLGCDELFAYNDNAIVGDGAGRYLYYYINTMTAAGVSRLRLGDEEQPVVGTSAVALVAWHAEEAGAEVDADIEGLYFAADYDTKDFFWLTFCSYKDGQPPKMFVVQDMEKGIAVLESGDVKYSVTGGDIDKCHPLMTKEDSASTDAWSSFDDDSMIKDADGLDFDIQ